MPEPKKGEDKQAYLSRCMKMEMMKDEYKKPDQRYSVCVSMYEKMKKGMGEKMRS